MPFLNISVTNASFPESQCGFWAKRATIDMIFSLRQLQKMQRAGKATLCCVYWPDHWPDHSPLWAEMAFSRSWPRLVVLLPYSESWSPFMITWREQFCTMVPLPTLSTSSECKARLCPSFLFGIFYATLLKHAFGEPTESIYLQIRLDGNLFKFSRLRAKTSVHEKYIHDLLFANDAAITTHT